MIYLILLIALVFLALFIVHHLVIFLIAGIAAYVLFHGHHSRKHWNSNGHRGFMARTWVSIPGPFHTRIGRRL